jgi:hypothetical protein
MKYLQTFESFVNEAKSSLLNEDGKLLNKITINAKLFSGIKPEIVKIDRAGDKYVLQPEDIFEGYLDQTVGKPSSIYMAIQTSNMYKDRVFIEMGYVSDDNGRKQYSDPIGERLQVHPDDLKNDPKVCSKWAADLFSSNAKYFDTSFSTYGGSATFKFEKDLSKPALDLIEFAIKNYNVR